MITVSSGSDDRSFKPSSPEPERDDSSTLGWWGSLIGSRDGSEVRSAAKTLGQKTGRDAEPPYTSSSVPAHRSGKQVALLRITAAVCSISSFSSGRCGRRASVKCDLNVV